MQEVKEVFMEVSFGGWLKIVLSKEEQILGIRSGKCPWGWRKEDKIAWDIFLILFLPKQE